jgi:TP901 family phage tail tape measure protein
VKSFGSQVSSLNRTLRATAATLGAGLGLQQVSRALSASVKEFASFQNSMAQVSTMLDKQTMTLMPQYTKQISELSKEFGESTETLARGLFDILSASVAPTKAIKLLRTATIAAKGGLTDTATAADALTTVLNAYNMEAEQATEITDKMFATIKRGKLTFADYAPNIGKVASLAATAGVAFEDLNASIATLTRAGVQTEIAMTSLRSIIQSLIEPTKEAVEVAAQLGLRLDENTLKNEGLVGVMDKLRKASVQQLQAIIPNVRGMAGLAAGIQQADGAMSDLRLQYKSTGLAQEAFDKQTDTTKHKMSQLREEWNEVKRSVGAAVSPPLTKVFSALNEAKDDAKEMREEFELMTWQIRTMLKLLDGVRGMMKDRGDVKGGVPSIAPVDINAPLTQRETGTLGGRAFDTAPIITGTTEQRPLTALELQVQELREQGNLFRQHQTLMTESARFIADEEMQNATRVADEKRRLAQEERKRIEEDHARMRSSARERMGFILEQVEIEKKALRDVSVPRGHALAAMDFQNDAMVVFQGNTEKAAEATDLFKRKLKELEEAEELRHTADSVGASFASAFEDMIMGANTAKDALKALGVELARLALQKTVTEPLMEGISGAFMNMFNTPSTTKQTTASKQGNVFNQPRMSLMAEAGPEAILPLERGPDGRLGVVAQGNGGGELNVIINNTGSAQIDVEKRERMGRDYIISVVAENARTGGQLRGLMLNG